MVQLEPIKHVYTNESGIIYDSWSKIQHFYKNHFPREEAAKAYAKNHGYTPSYWLRQWDKRSKVALKRGHTIHEDREDYVQARGVDKHKDTFMPVRNAYLYGKKNLSELPYAKYTELDIWNDSWKIAGRVDKAILYTLKGGTRVADIQDYKTNGQIEFESYKNPLTGQHKMMLQPVNHLMDCSWSLYTLQLSFYQYIFETWGFEPGERTLIHIPHPITGLEGEILQPKDVHYPVPYRKSEVMNILNDYSRRYRIAPIINKP